MIIRTDAIYENESLNVEVFEGLSTENKVTAILNSYSKGNVEEICVNNKFEGAKGFSTKNGTVVRLDTSGCLVSQYSDDNCWAASVATTLRYLNYSKFKSLSARNVCDKMNIGYDSGGKITDKQNALKNYGCTYSKLKYSQISFASIQDNILAQKPILMSTFSRTGGHAVTLIGHTTYGGINQITFHNSGNNSCSSVEYKTTGTVYSYNNKTWKWEFTLSAK